MPPAYPMQQRPHSTVATYLRHELQVTRFQSAVTRSGGRLHLRLRASILNHGKSRQVRFLMVGRCTSGHSVAPVCPATSTVRLSLAPGKTTSVTRSFVVHQPRPSLDQIEARIVSAEHRSASWQSQTDAFLLLKGQAWRGDNSGRVFGIHLAPNALVDRAVFEAVGLSPERVRVFARYDAASATALGELATTLRRCADSGCTDKTFNPQRGYSSTDHFGARPFLDRNGAQALGMDVDDAASTPQLSVLLPWPR